MSSEQVPLNTNTAYVNITSDYEYVLGATQGRLLEFQGLFYSRNFLDSQINQIVYDLEETAKYFAAQQGLAPGAVGWGVDGWNPDGTPMLRENTGRLYNGIRAYRTGQTVHLVSEAVDDYGHKYGGHVEFGHDNVPARPHLRPALYTVSQASQGKIRSALYNLLAGTFSGDMRMGFGTGGGLSTSYYRSGRGALTQYLSTGTRGRQTQYHFGSIRNTGGRGLSRKAQSFRGSFKNTAKRSMGWGKQKSLNPAQRASYRRAHQRPHVVKLGKGKVATSRRGPTLLQQSRMRQERTLRAKQTSQQRKYNRVVNRNNAFLANQQYQSRSSISSYRQGLSAAKQAEYQKIGQSYYSKEGLQKLYGQTIVHGQNYYSGREAKVPLTSSEQKSLSQKQSSQNAMKRMAQWSSKSGYFSYKKKD